jgi:hypothetical protein
VNDRPSVVAKAESYEPIELPWLAVGDRVNALAI